MPVSCSPMLPLHLVIDSYTQYSLFEKYLLSSDQLKQNDYPIEDCYRPGRICIPDDSPFSRSSGTRRCARCKQYYEKNVNHSYSRVSPCFYHPYKMNASTKTYPCCRQAYGSPGCRKGRYHVSAECDLGDVLFQKTRSRNSLFACKVFALDCEMVYTEGGMELAKVGIVGTDGRILYESFVKPEGKILDYNTEYSGVTSDDLVCGAGAVYFHEAQKIVLGLVTEDTILVGHGLENDLRALRLIHKKVVDTSVIFPRERAKYKRSLKSLAMEFLNKDVQTSANGHDCREDALTAMELVIFKIRMDFPSLFSAADNAEGLDPAYTEPSPAHSAVSRLNDKPVSNLWEFRRLVLEENNGDSVSLQSSESSSLHNQSLSEWILKQVDSLRYTHGEEYALATARQMYNDLYLHSLQSYLQQPEKQPMPTYFMPRNLMGQRYSETSDIADSRTMCQFENNLNQPNTFGFLHGEEWYPVNHY